MMSILILSCMFLSIFQAINSSFNSSIRKRQTEHSQTSLVRQQVEMTHFYEQLSSSRAIIPDHVYSIECMHSLIIAYARFMLSCHTTYAHHWRTLDSHVESIFFAG